jgi:ABC-type transporter Mla maintaining outer membrane lipid asymmetry ATPase subunit MlaF
MIWDKGGRTGETLIKKTDPNRSFTLHIKNILYSVPFTGIDPKIARTFEFLISEIKRDILYEIANFSEPRHPDTT